MATSSTTPQDRAVELIRKFIVTNAGHDAGYLPTVQAQELTILLGDAGLLSSGTQEEGDGSLRSEPAADGEASVYVLLSGRQVSHTLEEYEGSLNVDLDDYGEPVGVEILDARKVTINGRQVHPPQAIGEADIELVAEALRDFRLRLGPNTVDRIRDGADSIPLSGRERHEVAHAALVAMKALEET